MHMLLMLQFYVVDGIAIFGRGGGEQMQNALNNSFEMYPIDYNTSRCELFCI